MNGKKIVLAFDTSVTGCAVCVRDAEQSWTETMETERGQAEFLVPMIGLALDKSGYDYKDIERIAVTIGPGSFTGVRVGLSTAKALALSLNLPLLGFETLSVIAQGERLAEDTLILIDTKRGDFYGQIFAAGGRAQSEPCVMSDDRAEKSKLPVIKNKTPNVETLAKMAQAADNYGVCYSPELAPKPLYLRGAEASQSKRILPKIVAG